MAKRTRKRYTKGDLMKVACAIRRHLYFSYNYYGDVTGGANVDDVARFASLSVEEARKRLRAAEHQGLVKSHKEEMEVVWKGGGRGRYKEKYYIPSPEAKRLLDRDPRCSSKYFTSPRGKEELRSYRTKPESER
jgi:hypothetical protein